ncbi:hypothetical protein [uncultured Mediterranean phage uvMED]|nr:MAG: hypothetical protein CBD88_05970 [Flavobacteriales bacterium TMED228]BAQ87736.1 hypothetical protein [uncultured Mediterranean phage uvMED]BAQ87757.1 hypothetical protein [uncultured Mediterranean phage uvMED]
MKKNLGDAIKAINATAEFICEEDNLDNIQWINGTTPIAKTDIEAKIAELDTADETAKQSKIDLRASAKAKLIAGEALTEEEANTIVL